MKKLLIVLAGLLVVIAGAVYFVSSNLDGIVKAAIENYGSQATQTKVSVASVKLKLREGSGSISGLDVGNPSGFADPSIFRLGDISVKLDTSTVTKNPVVIDDLSISAPQVFYEIDKAGKANLDALKRNLDASTGTSSASSSGPGESSGGGIKLIIRHLVVDGGKASLRIAALGNKPMSVDLPRIVMTDVGKKSGGASALEVAQLLTKKMLGNVQGAVTKAGVQQYIGKSVDQLKQNLNKGVMDKVGGAGGQLGGAVKGLLGK